MKAIFKLTILGGAAITAAIAIPVYAGSQTNFLRGQFAPQSTIAEYEGRYVQPQSQYATAQTQYVSGQSQYVPWQHKRLQAQSYTQASSYTGAPSYTEVSSNHVLPRAAGIYYTDDNRKVRSGSRAYSKYASSKSRSTYGNVYDYESGHCGSDCAAPAPRYYRPVITQQYRPAVRQQSSALRKITQYKCWDGEVVATENGCKPQTITKTIPQFRCWDGEVVTDQNGCKPQTVTRQVQAPISAPSSYDSSSYGSISSTSGSDRQDCPSGTSLQTDGTCLETGGYNTGSTYSGGSSYGSGSSYNSGYSGGNSANCPSGTVKQTDGTCLESNSSGYVSPYAGSSISPYAGSSVELFTGNEPLSFLPLRK